LLSWHADISATQTLPPPVIHCAREVGRRAEGMSVPVGSDAKKGDRKK